MFTATESATISTAVEQLPTMAARRNWAALTRCIGEKLGFIPDDLRLEDAADFTGQTKHFALVIFREPGPSIEAEFCRRGQRWHCIRYELVD